MIPKSWRVMPHFPLKLDPPEGVSQPRSIFAALPAVCPLSRLTYWLIVVFSASGNNSGDLWHRFPECCFCRFSSRSDTGWEDLRSYRKLVELAQASLHTYATDAAHAPKYPSESCVTCPNSLCKPGRRVTRVGIYCLDTLLIPDSTGLA